MSQQKNSRFKGYKVRLIHIFILITILIYSSAGAVVLPDNSSSMGVGAQKSPSTNNSKTMPPFVEGEILVKMRSQKQLSSQDVVSKLRSNASGKPPLAKLKASSMRWKGKINSKKMDNWWRVELAPGQDVKAAISQLKSNPDVEYAEPNYIVNVQLEPNDVRYPELWSMNNIQQTGGTLDADIDAPEAWNKHKGSKSIVVAVIDTGVDYNHEDLANNMWTNRNEIPNNGIDDDGNGFVDDVHGYDFANDDGDPFDDHGHGTHCSGTVAALGNNEIGVTGVNWKSSIMAVKFLNSRGSGTYADAIEAVNYATAMGADIMSNSWGGGGFSQALMDAISAANDAGVVFVAAAGNSNRNNDIYAFYPSNYAVPNVVAVAATDHNDKRASFSNYGANTVHLGAPGVNILSTVPTGQCSLCDAGGYRLLNGTSMATPHVSGAAALMLARFPWLSVDEIKTQLLASVDVLSDMTGTTVSGGRLNVANALNMVEYQAQLTPSSQLIRVNSSVSYSMTIVSHSAKDEILALSVDQVAEGIQVAVEPANLTLKPGDATVATVNVTTGSNIVRGVYPVQVNITDSTGTSSTVEAELQTIVPGVEIVMSPEKQKVAVGKSVEYTAKIKSVDGYEGQVVLSTASPDPSIQLDFDSPSVSLPAYGETSVTMFANTSSETIAQIYPLTLKAKSRGKSYFGTASLEALAIDLVVPELDPRVSAVKIGQKFYVYGKVANQGASPTQNTFKIGVYLSSDEFITTDDMLVGETTFSGFVAGETRNLSTYVSVPYNFTAGNYYIGAIADSTNVEDETDEENNASVVSQISVIDDPDVCATGCSFSSIQSAIDMTPGSGVIIVGPGTYRESVNLGMDKVLVSNSGAENTVIDASGTGTSAVTLISGVISGFTISGGNADYGAGLYVRRGIVEGNIIRNNVATNAGGGLYMGSYSRVTVIDNQFINNSAIQYGGAITYGGYFSIEIRNNYFSGNEADRGGALLVGSYTTEIIESNIFDENSANYGGAIYVGGYSSATISNSLITRNSATYGSGVFVAGYTGLNLLNATITENQGVGIAFSSYNSARVSNSIIWNNTTDITVPYYGRPSISYSIIGGGYNGTGNLDVDPLFLNPGASDFRLTAGSLAIDSGMSVNVSYDLDGNARPVDGDGLGSGSTGDGSDFDMGAYEFQPQ